MTDPDLIFLSEPKIFAHDLHQLKDYFVDKFCSFLNSEDRYDPELPLVKNQAFGGTMVFWRRSLDPFISVHPVSTTSFLPIIYSHPGSPVTIHIALYLPTSGQESEFMEEITLLKIAIEDLKETHPEAFIFLRGDSNVNTKNKDRATIFENFCSTLGLEQIPINHSTYHHFVGNGLFDSSIDIIAHSKNAPSKEKVEKIFCQKNFPEVDSHHDIIMSSVSIPVVSTKPVNENLVTAPRIENTRQKIVWSEDKIGEYQARVAPKLAKIRNDWFIPNSDTSVSILLDLTNRVLNQDAAATNKSVALKICPKAKSLKIPPEIREAQLHLKRAHKTYKNAVKTNTADTAAVSENLKYARKHCRLLTRRLRQPGALARDIQHFSILSSNPSPLFNTIRSSKLSSAIVQFLS